jgi:hypothetical protein
VSGLTSDDVDTLLILIACADRDGCLDEADRGLEIVRKMEAYVREHITTADLRGAYLDGVIAERGIYGDASEWRVARHWLSAEDRQYWEERAVLRFPGRGCDCMWVGDRLVRGRCHP